MDTRREPPTMEELLNCNLDVLRPADICGVLGCCPEAIRKQAKDDPSALGFPVNRMGDSTRIPRAAFLKWFGVWENKYEKKDN